MHDKQLEERRKEIKELYDKDVVYKSLVDNYINASKNYEKAFNKASKKDKENVDSTEYTKAANVLHIYENNKVKEGLQNLMSSLNITPIDLADMFYNHIIPTKVMVDMILYKRGVNDEK